MKKLIAAFLFCISSFVGLQGQTEYYLDFNGKIHTNVPVKYDYEVGDGYKIFFNEGKYSAKDRIGKVVVEPTADKLLFLGSGVFAVPDGYKKIKLLKDSYSSYVLDDGCIGFVNGYMILHKDFGYSDSWAIDTTGKLTDTYSEFVDNGNFILMKGYDKGKVCRLYDKKTGLVTELKSAYDAFGVSEGLIRARTPEGKWGFADIATGKFIIPYNKKYEFAGDFIDGKAYITNEKETFCIDKEGKKLSIPKEQCINAIINPINGINIGIKFISDKDSLIALIDPASGTSTGFVYNRYKLKEGFFLMSDEKTIDIFNYRGKKIIDNLSKESTLQLNFGLLLVNDPIAKAISVYNRDGKQLLTQSNDINSVELYSGFLKIVANKRLFLATKNDNVWYFDFNGKLQDTEPENNEYPLADGYRMVKQGAYYGAKKADGSICIPLEHAKLRYLGSNVFFEEDSHNWGYFYKANGQKLLQEELEIYKFYNGFANGLITLTYKYDKEFSLMDSTGNMLFSELRYSPDDYYDVIRAGSTIMYRNSYEKKTLDVDYVSYFSEGRFLVGKNDKWGIADIQGNILLQPTCNVIYPFINGVAKIVNDGNELYIDINGKPIENATPFVSHEITTFGGMTKMYSSNGSEYLLSFRNNKTKKETGFKYIIYEPEILKNEKYLNGFIFVSNKEKTGSCLINYKGEEIASNLGIHDLNFERKTAMEGSNILVRTIKKPGDTKTNAKVFDREGKELLCVTDTFGKIELMNGFIKCYKQTEQDRIDDLKKPEVTHEDDVQVGSTNSLYTVSFIMQKVSSGYGTRSVSYACIYVEVSTTKNPSDSQLISAAQSAKNSVTLNGYQDYQTIVTKGGSSNAKKVVTSKVSLSDFRVEYAEY